MAVNGHSRKFLVFLTGGFPYGSGETFIENELPFLAGAFENVFLPVPVGVTDQPPRPLPQNATTIAIKGKHLWIQRILALTKFSFWKGLYLDIKRKNRATGFFNVFRNAWHHYSHGLQVKQAILKVMDQNKLKPDATILYSYWLDHKALGATLVKRVFPETITISRAHRWDVYEEMHPVPFWPFRPWLGKNLDSLIFISKQGQVYFEHKFPEVSKNQMELSYLGTIPLKKKDYLKKEKQFTIVSCSSLIPRKNVELIAQALLELKENVVWTHIGDGPELGKIKMLARGIEKKGGKVNIAGNLPNRAVREFYEENHIDLFISTSESEGLPVSMMEAQSAGIPILATDVGGVNEIVIEGVTGWLLHPNPNPALVAEKIREIYEMKDAGIKKIRQDAFNHWQNNFNAEKNYPAFVNLLKGL